MAINRLSVKVVGRGNTGKVTTRSAIAAAAYQAREVLHDEQRHVTYDLTAAAADLVRAEILLPEVAPYRWFDREVLWNEVEARERRPDAQIARSVVLTLPRELDPVAGADLARDFFRETFVRRGMVVDMAVHAKQASDGGPQPHAHALLTMRRIADGVFGLKERAWNSRALIREWREEWADAANRKLAEYGISARLDHRRVRERPVEAEPERPETRHPIRDVARLARAAAIIGAATVTRAMRDLAWRVARRDRREKMPLDAGVQRTPIDELREELRRPLREATVGVATGARTYGEALDGLVGDHLLPATKRHPELDARFEELEGRIGDALTKRVERLKEQIEGNAERLRQREGARESVMAERVAGAGLTEAEKVEVAQQEARWRKVKATPAFREMEARVDAMISAVSSGEARGFNYERDWSPRAAQYRADTEPSDRERAWRAAPPAVSSRAASRDEAGRAAQDQATSERSRVREAG